MILKRNGYLLSAILACAMVIMGSCRSTQQVEAVESNTLPAEKPVAAPADAGEWIPPPPAPDDFDWIRHKSGEWLKGDIVLLRYGTLTFDSEEMGELDFDYEDIVELRSPRVNSYLFEGDLRLVGTLLIRDGYVVVGGEEDRRFERTRLLTILPGEPKEANYWSGKVSLGITARSGNTDQSETNGRVNIERRTLATLVGLDYTGNYGKLEGEENVNNHRLTGNYQIFLTDRLYVTPFAFEAYRDPFKNIEYRLTPGAGMGYYLFDRSDLEWNVEGLAGYQYTKYDTVEPGEDRRDATAAAIAQSHLEMDLIKDVDLELEYRISYALTSGTRPDHHALVGISIELNDILDLDVTAVWDRVGNPERDANGELPEKDDYSLTVGLGIEF